MATSTPGAYTDKFGGLPVLPNDIGYNPLALVGNVTLVWPEYPAEDATYGSTPVLAGLTAISNSYNGDIDVTLPDTTLVEAGRAAYVGLAESFYPGKVVNLKTAGGATLYTLNEGDFVIIYSTTNTNDSSWAVIQMGTGATFASAASYAGMGLKAIGATLNFAPVTSTISTDTTITASNRAGVFVNTGGAIVVTFPLTSTVGNDFSFEIRNQGTGTVTLTPTGGELLDSSATIALQVNESCIVHSATGAWYTVGRGRNASFNFTQLTKAVTGGTTTLTTTEASNVVQKYTGVLLSNQTLVVPSVVQVYYISNQTTGAFSFTIQSPTPGTTLVLPSGQNAVVFCDGVNVINCSTSLTGISALLLLLGSAATPSLAFGAVNNGLFGPSNVTVAVSAGGTEVVRWAGTQTQAAVGSAGLPAYSFQLSNTTGMYRSGADELGFSTAGTQRALVNAAGEWSFGPSAPTTARGVTLNKDITGATVAYGISVIGTIKSGVTVASVGVHSAAATEAAAFTVGDVRHFQASQGTIGAGSAITTQAGLYVSGNIVGAANNYGVQLMLPAGAANWNIYAPATAQNYLAGKLGVGVVPSANTYLYSKYAAAAAVTSEYATFSELRATNTSGAGTKTGAYGIVYADAGYAGTGSLIGVQGVVSTGAAGITVPSMIGVNGQLNMAHAVTVTTGTCFRSDVFNSGGATFGSTQGFLATEFASNNHVGFYSQVTSGTGKYAFYAQSTAQSAFLGNVTVGTTTLNSGGAKLQVSDGITFPAVAVPSTDVNTLDDYEEGTWTPTITPASSTLNFLTRAGFYTKVGNKVTVTGYIQLDTSGNTLNPNTVVITGLPFACKTASNIWFTPRVIWGGLGTAVTGISALLGSGATTMILYRWTASTITALSSVLNHTEMSATAGTQFYLDFTYLTD